MTDAQLIIILRNYRRQLMHAIGQVRKAMPKDAERHGNQPIGDFVALAPLRDFIIHLNEDIATLQTGEATND